MNRPAARVKPRWANRSILYLYPYLNVTSP
jgi:hypothetical protein